MVLSMKKSFNNKDISKNDHLEELHYGPGIVSKLRCRYMSLTLNQGCTKQRPSLNFLRRSTSLNNLIESSEAKVEHQGTEKVDDVKINGNSNSKTKSYETLLDTNERPQISKGNGDKSSENDQPPPDMVKEKLRIFEPNWMSTKKVVHYPKKYVTSKNMNGINSKIVTNIREKYQEKDESIPNFADKFERLKHEISTKSNVSVSKVIVSKPLEKPKSDIEKPIVQRDTTSSKTTHDETQKTSQKNSQPSVESQSMIFNFSKRKDIPSHLPDLTHFDDKSLSVVDYEDSSSPSKFEFINANVVFEGKSCMKTVGRNVKLKIKFNDLLTSTFEYPSENCVFESPVSPTSKVDIPQDVTPIRSKVVLVVSKNGTETTDNFSGCKTDSKAFWSDETHSTDILF